MNGPANTYHYSGPYTARRQYAKTRFNTSWKKTFRLSSRVEKRSQHEATWIFLSGAKKSMNWTSRSSVCFRSVRLQRLPLGSSRQRAALPSTSRNANRLSSSTCDVSIRGRCRVPRCRTCMSGSWMSCARCSVKGKDLKLRFVASPASLPCTTNSQAGYRGLL